MFCLNFITESLARPPSSLSLASMASDSTARLARPPSVTSFVGPLSPVTTGPVPRFPRTGSVGHLQQLRSPGINLDNELQMYVIFYMAQFS